MNGAEKAEWYSYQDYLSWPEGERIEVIQGVPYAMSPAPRREHQRLVSAIHGQLFQALRGALCEVYPAPFDVKLSQDTEDDRPTVVQPDLTVICDPEKLTEQGMTGAPDLVIEIVSPDSGFHDRVWSEAALPARPCVLGRKFDLYRDAGVREYWIVDPDERVVEVYRLEADGSYRRVGAFGDADTITAAVTDRIVVDLAEVFPGGGARRRRSALPGP
ncbi:MAG: Uma2 family endonuclease [Spirochaeta sp.]|jgi:Uma2 family endonuclease|nr:Uma2 family endonuclease [Spirochaeta sp.]